jgi:ABC-type Mn2+/Zn2+ transport system permease subunit
MLESIYTVILALLAALAAGLVGGFALMRRMSLAGDAVSHIALPGLGLALVLHIHPLLGAAATLLLGAVLIWRLEVHSGLDTETVVGVVFSASLAAGALLTPSEELLEALFGGFGKASGLEFAAAVALTLAILAALYYWKDEFILSLFSAELASATGLRRRRLELAFSVIFSMTVLVGLRFLGVLLAGALIVIPAAVARQWTSRLGPFLLTSAAVSTASVGAGMALAGARHLSQGPSVVAVAGLAFVMSLAVHGRSRAPRASRETSSTPNR